MAFESNVGFKLWIVRAVLVQGDPAENFLIEKRVRLGRERKKKRRRGYLPLNVLIFGNDCKKFRRRSRSPLMSLLRLVHAVPCQISKLPFKFARRLKMKPTELNKQTKTGEIELAHKVGSSRALRCLCS